MRLITGNLSTFVFAIALLFLYNYKMASKFSKGTPAPTFAANTIDGEVLDLEDLKGQYVLLDFWASWCGPCRRQNPRLVRLYDKYENAKFKNAEKFTIVSVALEKNPNSWKTAIKKDNLHWKHHLLDQKFNQKTISDWYKVSQIPAKILINEKGEIIGSNWSANKIDRFLRNQKL